MKVTTLLYIFTFWIFAFVIGAIAFDSSCATENKVSTKIAVSSCDPILLLRDGKLRQAYECSKKIKNIHFIKAVQWLYYSDQRSPASFEETNTFMQTNPNFPDRNKLKMISEQRIDDSTDNKILSHWCKNNVPATGNGAKYCLSSLSSSKDSNLNTHIAKLAKIIWSKESLTSQEETLFIKKYGNLITARDHINRLNYLLSTEKKLSPVAFNAMEEHYKELFRVKLKLTTEHRYLDTKHDVSLLKRVASHLRKEPFLLYLRAKWYMFRNDGYKLVALFKEHPTIDAIKSDQWAKIRTLLVWDLLDIGDHKTAYEIASSHKFQEATNYVDGEWLAGRIAYFNLKNPEVAYNHFKNIFERAKYSVSLAKGAYWSGVAASAMRKNSEAKYHFIIASKYLDTFYGQLALMRLYPNSKARMTLPSPPDVSESDVTWVQNNDLLKLSHIFSSAHKSDSARKFIQGALDSADTDGKKYLISKFGEHVNVDMLATISGKEAARRGMLAIHHSYPILKTDHADLSVDRALIHAIIRQESEFNPVAKSSAGAVGLMQLMYPTAKDIGRKLNRTVARYSLRDPSINVLLGSEHLNQVLKKYEGSYVLSIAAYNAGEKRVDEWIIRFGDPRRFKNIDKVVEWIENIPFFETRSYVQHVLSNLQIYKNMLSHGKESLKSIEIDLKKDLLS